MRTTQDIEWTARPMGARVDLADKDVVYAILDRATVPPSRELLDVRDPLAK